MWWHVWNYLPLFLEQVDQAISSCSEMHNIKDAIYENKSKLEGIGEDYQIQVSDCILFFSVFRFQAGGVQTAGSDNTLFFMSSVAQNSQNKRICEEQWWRTSDEVLSMLRALDLIEAGIIVNGKEMILYLFIAWFSFPHQEMTSFEITLKWIKYLVYLNVTPLFLSPTTGEQHQRLLPPAHHAEPGALLLPDRL